MLADGELTLSEIFEGKNYLANLRLIVLSACQTSIIDFQSLPDEVLGLPIGLLQAGVPSVIGTLWSVNDRSTALLMTRFYELMLMEHMPVHKALCQAQVWLRDLTFNELSLYQSKLRLTRDLRQIRDADVVDPQSNPWDITQNDKPFSDPYYWAPFALYGA